MPKRAIEAGDRLLTHPEVAELFKVSAKTVSMWHRDGKFPPGSVTRTPGGTRRFKEAAVLELLHRESAP